MLSIWSLEADLESYSVTSWFQHWMFWILVWNNCRESKSMQAYSNTTTRVFQTLTATLCSDHLLHQVTSRRSCPALQIRYSSNSQITWYRPQRSILASVTTVPAPWVAPLYYCQIHAAFNSPKQMIITWWKIKVDVVRFESPVHVKSQ